MWPSEEVKTVFGLGLLFIQFFIPVMVLIICYGQIIWVLTRRINTDLMKNKSKLTMNNCDTTVNVSTITKVVDPGKKKFQLARRNTIKTLLIVGLCFIICWSQNQILFFMYKARHAHKRLYTVLPKYSKIQVLPGITSCRLVKDNKQAIELNSLLINNMPKDGYE